MLLNKSKSTFYLQSAFHIHVIAITVCSFQSLSGKLLLLPALLLCFLFLNLLRNFLNQIAHFSLISMPSSSLSVPWSYLIFTISHLYYVNGSLNSSSVYSLSYCNLSFIILGNSSVLDITTCSHAQNPSLCLSSLLPLLNSLILSILKYAAQVLILSLGFYLSRSQ